MSKERFDWNLSEQLYEYIMKKFELTLDDISSDESNNLTDICDDIALNALDELENQTEEWYDNLEKSREKK